MVLDALKRFFDNHMMPPEGSEGPADGGEVVVDDDTDARLRLAACALLVELAHADDEFSPSERAHLEEAVRRHFGLEGDRLDGLLALAERERSRATDLWHFTTLIRQRYSTGQKMVLAEIMWGLVYSDGELSSHEEYLMRKISKLLGLEIGYLSAARARVRDGDAAGGEAD